MEIYLNVFVLLFALAALDLYVGRRDVSIVTLAAGVVLLVLFVGLRWETGNDWVPYLLYYNESNVASIAGFEPGYRVLATPLSEEYEESGEAVALGQRGNILDLYFGGDLSAAFAFGGQVAGRIEDVRPVAEIIVETIEEFHDTIRALGKLDNE